VTKQRRISRYDRYLPLVAVGMVLVTWLCGLVAIGAAVVKVLNRI